MAKRALPEVPQGAIEAPINPEIVNVEFEVSIGSERGLSFVQVFRPATH